MQSGQITPPLEDATYDESRDGIQGMEGGSGRLLSHAAEAIPGIMI